MTIGDFVKLSAYNALLLFCSVIVGILGGVGYSLTQPTLYSASASGVVVVGSQDSLGQVQSSMALSAAKAGSYVNLVSSKRVQNAALKLVEKDFPQGARVHSLTGSRAPDSNVLTITASAPSPREASAIATAAVVATAEEALRLESMQLDGTSSGMSAVRLVPNEQASIPVNPVSPTWARNVPIGAGVGLVAGYLLVFLRRAIDRRVRTQADVIECGGLSVIGVIPKDLSLDAEATDRPAMGRGPASEAMRRLRTNLRFVSVDEPPKSIVITSANPSEGKSTVALSLSRVLAESGQKVLLIDADLRRPSKARRMGVDNSIGLTQVLAGDVSLADAVQPTESPNLVFLGAGRIPPNPSELVGSQRMRKLIASVSEEYTVIVDSPPILPVTDAGLLAEICDGAVIVCRAGSTQKDELGEAIRMLNQVKGRLFGSVLNLVTKRAMGEDGYGYTYGYYYYEDRYASGPRNQADGATAVRKRKKGRRAARR